MKKPRLEYRETIWSLLLRAERLKPTRKNRLDLEAISKAHYVVTEQRTKEGLHYLEVGLPDTPEGRKTLKHFKRLFLGVKIMPTIFPIVPAR